MKPSGIGGQAVLEGIMMKNKDKYAVAVRKPNQEIEVCVKEYKGITKGNKILNLPFIRGVFNFIDSLIIGMSTLMFSAEFYEEEEAEEVKKGDKVADSLFKEKAESAVMTITVIVAALIAIGLFVVLPSIASDLIKKHFNIVSYTIISLIEGLIRITLFLLYIFLISRMKDIQRTFMYHGAEHKCINCIEHGMELNVDNVLKSSRLHKRCGTSFVFIVMFISIVVFMFVRTDVMWMRLLSRVLLVPLIAGISYEFIRYAGKHNNACSNVLSAPGLWVQRLTTKEPDDSMIEVAIKSVEGVIDWREYVDAVRNNSFES